MPVKTDWQIALSEVDPALILSGSTTRMMAKASVREDWEIALADSQALIQPAAVWEFARVRKFLHERVVMENGAVLTGGPIAEVMAGAEHLIVAVCTAGAAITQASAVARQNGDLMRSMFYEMFGTYAVGTIRQQMVDMFEKEIKSQGLHISTMLSPGESTWPVSQQAELFSLVDTAPIGVTLTDSMMMNPIKSTSMVLGFGPNALGSEGATNCDFCTIRDTCPGSKAGNRKA